MTFQEYLEKYIANDHQQKLITVLDTLQSKYPNLLLETKWNQPMFTYNNTFIIGFSGAKNHFSVAYEKLVLDKYREEIKKKYTDTKKLFHIKWDEIVDYELLFKMIDYTLGLKKDYQRFWL
jgi:uncharacterized protein YdhG (YjbR/CyaY superfamily)